MAHLIVYDKTKPADTELLGKGDDYIRNTLQAIYERMVLDHCFEGILDISLPTADGFHKKITMKFLTVDPSVLSIIKIGASFTVASPTVVTITGHGFATGDAITLSSTGTLPGGTSANMFFYVRYINANTFNLCPTYEDAIAGTNKILATSAGTGTISATKNTGGIVYSKSGGLYFRNGVGVVKII